MVLWIVIYFLLFMVCNFGLSSFFPFSCFSPSFLPPPYSLSLPSFLFKPGLFLTCLSTDTRYTTSLSILPHHLLIPVLPIDSVWRWGSLMFSCEMKWKSLAQSYLILCNPTDCSPPGSSVHGILQARILAWVAIPFSRGSSQPRDWTQVSCIAGRFFTIWTTREDVVLAPPPPPRPAHQSHRNRLPMDW